MTKVLKAADASHVHLKLPKKCPLIYQDILNIIQNHLILHFSYFYNSA